MNSTILCHLLWFNPKGALPTSLRTLWGFSVGSFRAPQGQMVRGVASTMRGWSPPPTVAGVRRTTRPSPISTGLVRAPFRETTPRVCFVRFVSPSFPPRRSGGWPPSPLALPGAPCFLIALSLLRFLDLLASMTFWMFLLTLFLRLNLSCSTGRTRTSW